MADDAQQFSVNRRLADLADKAARKPGARLSDFDWSQRPKGIFPGPKALSINALSQLYHGENAAQGMCRSLAPRLDLPEARACIEAQQEDESRHVAIYERYLTGLGGIAPRLPAYERAMEAVNAWNGAAEARILACHALLEVEALGLDEAIAGWSSCGLLRDISSRIASDEARHVAFGRIYLPEKLATMPQAERLEIYRWLRDIWFDLTGSVIAGCGGFLVGSRRRRTLLGHKWAERSKELQAIGLYDTVEARLFEGP